MNPVEQGSSLFKARYHHGIFTASTYERMAVTKYTLNLKKHKQKLYRPCLFFARHDDKDAHYGYLRLTNLHMPMRILKKIAKHKEYGQAWDLPKEFLDALTHLDLFVKVPRIKALLEDICTSTKNVQKSFNCLSLALFYNKQRRGLDEPDFDVGALLNLAGYLMSWQASTLVFFAKVASKHIRKTLSLKELGQPKRFEYFEMAEFMEFWNSPTMLRLKNTIEPLGGLCAFFPKIFSVHTYWFTEAKDLLNNINEVMVRIKFDSALCKQALLCEASQPFESELQKSIGEALVFELVLIHQLCDFVKTSDSPTPYLNQVSIAGKPPNPFFGRVYVSVNQAPRGDPIFKDCEKTVENSYYLSKSNDEEITGDYELYPGEPEFHLKPFSEEFYDLASPAYMPSYYTNKQLVEKFAPQEADQHYLRTRSSNNPDLISRDLEAVQLESPVVPFDENQCPDKRSEKQRMKHPSIKLPPKDIYEERRKRLKGKECEPEIQKQSPIRIDMEIDINLDDMSPSLRALSAGTIRSSTKPPTAIKPLEIEDTSTMLMEDFIGWASPQREMDPLTDDLSPALCALICDNKLL